MVLKEWRLLEPFETPHPGNQDNFAALIEPQENSAAVIQTFWERIDIETHNLNVAYLSLFALTHHLSLPLSSEEAEVHVFTSLHHDDGKKSPKIKPEVYFEPDMSREQVMEVFGDHGVNTVEMLLERFPCLDPRAITQAHWHHPYSQNYKNSYSSRLLDLTDPANEAAKHMVELQIVCDRVSAGVELRHQKTESKSDQQIMEIITSEFAAYPSEWNLSYDHIDIETLIHEAQRVQHQPFSWVHIAHELQIFGEQTGNSIIPLYEEIKTLDELVNWTLVSFLENFAGQSVS